MKEQQAHRDSKDHLTADYCFGVSGYIGGCVKYKRTIFKLHSNTKAVSGNSSSSSRFGKLVAYDQINKFSIKRPHIAIKQKLRHSV